MVQLRASLDVGYFRPALIRLQQHPEVWDSGSFTVRLCSFDTPKIEITMEESCHANLSQVPWFQAWGATAPVELVDRSRWSAHERSEWTGKLGLRYFFDAADVTFEPDPGWIHRPHESVLGALICEGALSDPDPRPVVLVRTGGFPFRGDAKTRRINVCWNRAGILQVWKPEVEDYRRTMRFDPCKCGETRTVLEDDREVCSACRAERP